MRSVDTEADRRYHDVIGGEYDQVVVRPRQIINDAVFSEVARFVRAGELMLDLGCGTGHATLRFAKQFNRAIAVDHSAAMLEAARPNFAASIANVTVVHDEIFNVLPRQPEGAADAVFCVGFLHHLGESGIERLLLEIRRVLQVGGQMVLSEPRQIPPDSVPAPIAAWNAGAHVGGYSVEAHEPDEEPVIEEWLASAAVAAGFSLERTWRHWEIFPRSAEPSTVEISTMLDLHRQFGATGNAVTMLLRT